MASYAWVVAFAWCLAAAPLNRAGRAHIGDFPEGPGAVPKSPAEGAGDERMATGRRQRARGRRLHIGAGLAALLLSGADAFVPAGPSPVAMHTATMKDAEAFSRPGAIGDKLLMKSLDTFHPVVGDLGKPAAESGSVTAQRGPASLTSPASQVEDDIDRTAGPLSTGSGRRMTYGTQGTPQRTSVWGWIGKGVRDTGKALQDEDNAAALQFALDAPLVMATVAADVARKRRDKAAPRAVAPGVNGDVGAFATQVEPDAGRMFSGSSEGGGQPPAGGLQGSLQGESRSSGSSQDKGGPQLMH